MQRVAQQEDTTVVVVTHDSHVSDQFARTITIRDGRVGAEGRDGEDYVAIGTDGVLHLPPDMLDVLPPGSLARATRLPDGVRLQRIDGDPSLLPGVAMPQQPEGRS